MFIRANKQLLFFTGVYVIISVIDFILFRDFVQSNDAFPYLWIAKLYNKGLFHDAISGYWSPLLSWLCAPIINFFSNPVWCIKIINKIFGLIGLWIGLNFFENNNRQKTIKNILISMWILLLSIYSHTETPDFISANLLLLITFLLVNKSKKLTNTNALTVGVLASIAYLCKLYNFIFVQIIILTLLLFNIRNSHFKHLLKWYLIQLLVFISISFAWIFTLYNKFGDWNYERSYKFNKAILGPDNCDIKYIEQNMINPQIKMGLMSPLSNQIYINPDEHRILNNVNDWKMLSKKNFTRTLKIIIRNLKSIYYDFVLRYILAPYLFLLILNRRKLNTQQKQNHIKLILISVLYLTGYISIFYIPRYAYYVHFIVFLALALFCFELFKTSVINRLVFALATLLLVRNQSILIKWDYEEFYRQRFLTDGIVYCKKEYMLGNTCLLANLDPRNAKELDRTLFDYSFINFYLENPQCGVFNEEKLNKDFVEQTKALDIKFVFCQTPQQAQVLYNLGFKKSKPIGINGLTLAYN